MEFKFIKLSNLISNQLHRHNIAENIWENES